jgi:hypothetical protein
VFIEFWIDDQTHSFLSSHLFKMLESEVADWSAVNKIPYTSKHYKNTYRVAFNEDKHYTVFRLTWQDLPYIEHRLIDRRW